MKARIAAIVSVFSVSVVGCGGSSKSMTATTTLKSSLLSSSSSVSLHTFLRERKQSALGLNDAFNACPVGDTTCFTPSALSGKFSTFSLRVGDGGTYTRIDLITPTSQGALTNAFNLASPTALDGTFTCCDPAFGASASYKDLLWTVGQFDVTFDASTFGFAEAVTLRYFFADDSTSGALKGDVQLKVGEDFKFCPTTATAATDCVATRPDSPVVQEAVYTRASESEPELPYLSAGLFASASSSAPIEIGKSSDFQDKSWAYTVDFDLDDAFAVAGASKTFTSVFAVMPKLYLRGFAAAPSGVMVAGGVNAILTVTAK